MTWGSGTGYSKIKTKGGLKIPGDARKNQKDCFNQNLTQEVG